MPKSESITIPSVSVAGETDFENEVRLDPEIDFRAALSGGALNPRAVFLTGATGFLGVYLLEELLTKTEAVVFCLVRAADTVEARRRIVSQLKEYDLWRESFSGRILPIAGDLTQPYFGLEGDQFRELAAQTDVIYHSAGSVNMAFPYARLKPINVVGTHEVLRLAGLVSTKPVHFMSSIAVFFSDAHPAPGVVSERDAPLYDPSLKGGYSKSKWVADRLVAAAQARGLPACIYRPVRIMGHSQTGAIHEMSDILPLLLKGCILLRQYPAFDIQVTLVPVDYVCRAMVHLASQEKSWGRAFHFFNPAPIAWRRLMAVLQTLAYPLEGVAYDQWWQALKDRIGRSAAQTDADKSFFAGLLLGLTAPHFLFYKRPGFDAADTREGLAGTDITCPPVDDALIATYVAYWQKSGYLPLPGEQG